MPNLKAYLDSVVFLTSSYLSIRIYDLMDFYHTRKYLRNYLDYRLWKLYKISTKTNPILSRNRKIFQLSWIVTKNFDFMVILLFEIIRIGTCIWPFRAFISLLFCMQNSWQLTDIGIIKASKNYIFDVLFIT